MLCITLTDSFYFYFKNQKLKNSFTFIWKNILCCIFLCSYAIFFLRAWIAINSKIWFRSSCNKPILTLKNIITDFCRWQYFAYFDIKVAFLGQYSFEWVALCYVECCLFQTYIEIWNFFAIVTCSWLFQFYSSKVLS